MATEEDNFDIDIYGEGDGEADGGIEDSMDYNNDQNGGGEEEIEHEFTVDAPEAEPALEHPVTQPKTMSGLGSGAKPPDAPASMRNAAASNQQDTEATSQQGVKRKESSDDRPIDHNATNALLLSDLHWWTTEDDIRSWINAAGAEQELKDITFNEHKVNGKSKGQVYLEFASLQSSTATKRKIEYLSGEQPGNRKFNVAYTTAAQTSFKTLPKDGAPRNKDDRPTRGTSASFTSGTSSQGNYSNGPAYRGGRGGFRGGYNNQNSYHRNFSGPPGNYNPTNGANMGVMSNYNNFGRGNMSMGMRGGRGAINNMMPMSGMPMGGMMNPVMASMGMGMPGFQQGNHFNPAMFNQAQNFGTSDWNQQGIKRQRHE